MKKVFVFPSSFGKFSDEPERILREAGLEVTKFFKAGMTEDEVIEKLQGYDAVILGIEPMTARVMEACPQLKIVSRYGVGMDNVDQEAARRLGIRVRSKENPKELFFAHTLNNTVVAPPRMLIAFLENNLREDGSVAIPKPLQPYMGGMTELRKK